MIRARARRSSVATAAGLAVLLVAGMLGLAPLPAAAFNPAQQLLGINAGNGPILTSGPDGSNLAAFNDRDAKAYRTAFRPVGNNQFNDPIPVPGGGYAPNQAPTLAILDDLSLVMASTVANSGFTTYKMAIWRMTPSATAWTGPTLIDLPSADAYAASVAITPDGSVTFAWNNATDKQVNVARVAPGGSTLGAIQKVGTAGTGTFPRATVGRGGTTMLWWAQSGSTNLLTSFRAAPSSTFGTPQVLPRNGIDDQQVSNLSVAIGDDGRALIAAEARSGAAPGTYHVITWSRPKNGTWADDVTVPDIGGYSRAFPSVGMSGDGSAVVAWETVIDNTGTGARVDVSTKGPGATDTWGTPQTVSRTSKSYARPKVAVGDDGSAAITWDDSDGQTFEYGEPGVIYTSAHNTHLVYRTTQDATFTPWEAVSARRANDGAVAVTASTASVVAGWFESTHYATPLSYGAMLATSGPAGVAKATLTVNSTTDRPATQGGAQGCKTGQFVAGKPECTLRAAIQAVNAGKGNAVDFDIDTAGGEAPTIEVATALPDVGKPVTIDGTTQAGGMVEVLGADSPGPVIAGAGSVVKGLAIAGFTGPALTVTGAGTKVMGNRIGTDAAGTAYRQVGSGIVVALGSGITIGGATAAEGNQIVTGPDGIGVYGISDPTHPATNLVVRHNTIGMDPQGTAALGAGPTTAVLVAGGGAIKSTISDNVVTGTKMGIGVFGIGAADSTIASNTVGMDAARTARIGEPQFGIRVDGAARTSIATNAVAAKGWDVVVTGSVQASFSATSYQLSPPTSSKTTGTVTGGDEKVTGNLVGIFGDGTKAPGSGSEGITVWGGAERTLIQDNSVAGHTSAEVRLIRGKDIRILKNRIGVNPTGTAVLGATSGVVATSSPGVVIGDGNTTGNRIGGAAASAILLNGSSSEAGGGGTIAGNALGLLADGTTPAGNGVGISALYAPNTTIGPDNVVANSTNQGISLGPTDVGSTVTGNWIGVTALGTAKAPNGIGVVSAAPTGSDPLQADLTITGNTISGNGGGGIVASGGNVKVLLNRIGVSPTTLADLGNGGPGVVIDSDGGEVQGNVIGFNSGSGLAAAGTGLAIADNQVGQPSAAETDIGNSGDGIAIAGAGKATGNVVGHNGGAGINLSSTAKVEVRANRIAANAGSGVVTQSTEQSIIRDNRIGLAAATDTARPNDVGVKVLGGKALIKANRIGASTNAGIDVAAGATATLASNAIFGSGGPKAIVAPPPTIPAAPTLTWAVRKGTGDGARTWLLLKGPAQAGTFEAFGNVDCSDPEAKVPMATGAWPGGDQPVVLTVRGRPDLNGYTVTFTQTDTAKTSELSTCATVDSAASDDDADGIPTKVEAASPWSDAPGSGKFVAVPSDNGGWVGLREADLPFTKVTPVDAPAGRPAGLELPFGVISFEIKVPTGDAQVDLFTSGVAAGDHYWKYGSDEGKPAAWYRFDYREKPVAGAPGFFEKTGAKKQTFTIDGQPYAGYRIAFDDGLRGDDTTTADGWIRDPGGGASGGVDDSDCPTAAGNARYVCRVYQYGLGRSPDAAGQAYWVRRLDAGGSRSSVMAAFINSAESRRTVVRRIYSTYLHRAPDPSGLAYWTDRLGAGLSPEALRVNLLASSDYLRRSGATSRDWAAAVYADVVRRTPSDAELDLLADALDGGASRASLATFVLHTAEGRATVIAQLYELYLERTPASSETTYWQHKLAAGSTELQLAVGIVASNEFARK